MFFSDFSVDCLGTGGGGGGAFTMSALPSFTLDIQKIWQLMLMMTFFLAGSVAPCLYSIPNIILVASHESLPYLQ